MFGQIAGALIGGVMGNSAAKSDQRNQRYMNEMNNRGYTDARPYITGAYEGGQKALDDALAKGYYGGPTYAGFNDQMKTGLDNRFNLGSGGFNNANNFMNIGANYAGNTADLYNRASRDNLSGAMDYATANSQPLIDAAMRGANRNLNEVQLPGMNMGASGSGNTNSSRAGIAEAVLRRGNAELEADTTARVNRGLMDDYMTQADNQFRNMSSANTSLGNLFGTGFNLGNTSTGMQTEVGGAYQGDEQARMDDDRARFEGERDFAMNQYGNFMSNILGRAPMSPSGYSPNMSNPMMGGMQGAMAGFGFGGKHLQPMVEKYSSGGSAGPQRGFGALSYYDPNGSMQPYTGANLL